MINCRIAESMWGIEIVPPNSPGLLVGEENLNGATWFTLQKIYISSDVPKCSVKQVIIHELTHAFLYSTQMRIPDKMTEEEVCDFFGRWGCAITEQADYIFSQLYQENERR